MGAAPVPAPVAAPARGGHAPIRPQPALAQQAPVPVQVWRARGGNAQVQAPMHAPPMRMAQHPLPMPSPPARQDRSWHAPQPVAGSANPPPQPLPAHASSAQHHIPLQRPMPAAVPPQPQPQQPSRHAAAAVPPPQTQHHMAPPSIWAGWGWGGAAVPSRAPAPSGPPFGSGAGGTSGLFPPYGGSAPAAPVPAPPMRAPVEPAPPIRAPVEPAPPPPPLPQSLSGEVPRGLSLDFLND